jgi:hypothetical protein
LRSLKAFVVGRLVSPNSRRDFVLGWRWNLGLWRRGESQFSNECFLVQFGAFFREEFVVFRYMDVMSLLH